MMFNCFIVVLLFIAASQAASLPFDDESDGVIYLGSPLIMTNLREKRSAYPGRAMMFHGYFGNGGHPYQNGYPRHNGRSYDPQSTMTAFAAGDAVSAGSSYYGNGGGYECSNCNGARKPVNGNGKKNGNGHSGHDNGHPINGNGNGHNGHPANGNGFSHQDPAQVPVGNGKPEAEKPLEEQDPGYPGGNGNGNGAENEVPVKDGEEGYLGDQPAAEETPKGETLPPAPPTQPTAAEGPKKVPDDQDDEEEDEPSFFSHKGRGRGPYYNSYFPMVFGAFPGYGGGRGGNREDGGTPGVATAIANSFSTGRGAVATSHATAYGGPQFIPSGYKKNGSRARSH